MPGDCRFNDSWTLEPEMIMFTFFYCLVTFGLCWATFSILDFFFIDVDKQCLKSGSLDLKSPGKVLKFY